MFSLQPKDFQPSLKIIKQELRCFPGVDEIQETKFTFYENGALELNDSTVLTFQQYCFSDTNTIRLFHLIQYFDTLYLHISPGCVNQ